MLWGTRIWWVWEAGARNIRIISYWFMIMCVRNVKINIFLDNQYWKSYWVITNLIWNELNFKCVKSLSSSSFFYLLELNSKLYLKELSVKLFELINIDKNNYLNINIWMCWEWHLKLWNFFFVTQNKIIDMIGLDKLVG